MKRALLADDEATIRLTLTAILELNGFEVETASSAETAKQALAAAPFDLVITDLKMESDTAGFLVTEFAATVRPQPVAVIVSAFPKLGLDWAQHGAHPFFEKPIPIAEFLPTIEELLKLYCTAAAA